MRFQPKIDELLRRYPEIRRATVPEYALGLRLGVDTTVDLNDIRHKRPTLVPFQGRV